MLIWTSLFLTVKWGFSLTCYTASGSPLQCLRDAIVACDKMKHQVHLSSFWLSGSEGASHCTLLPSLCQSRWCWNHTQEAMLGDEKNQMSKECLPHPLPFPFQTSKYYPTKTILFNSSPLARCTNPNLTIMRDWMNRWTRTRPYTNWLWATAEASWGSQSSANCNWSRRTVQPVFSSTWPGSQTIIGLKCSALYTSNWQAPQVFSCFHSEPTRGCCPFSFVCLSVYHLC